MTLRAKLGRYLGKGVALLLLALAGVAAVQPFSPSMLTTYEQHVIDFARTWRRAIYRLGYPLPGTPDLSNLDARLGAAGLRLGAPVLLRVFKQDFELELWLAHDGRFQHFATYPICRWSGRLGPKYNHGDRQAPEGFYTVGAASLNPRSRWHRSFDLGFPNAFDRAHGRRGSFLMVHGGCSSAGCYAMTNPVIEEIWRLVTAALKAGQKRFQVQAFPFRMTEENLARHAQSTLAPFWLDLKRGYDLFETSHLPPRVSVCSGRYAFEPAQSEGDGSAPPVAAGCPQGRDGSHQARL